MAEEDLHERLKGVDINEYEECILKHCVPIWLDEL